MVRLPDHLLDFVDDQVAAGAASSRADVVRSALEQQRQRLLAEADIAVVRVKPGCQLDAVTRAVSGATLDI